MNSAGKDKAEIKKELVYGILQFLDEEIKGNFVSSDAQESLEVAMQCLESAYEVNLQDPDCVSKYRRQESLLSRLEQLKLVEEAQMPPEPSEEDKEEAEKAKVEGNDLMKTEKYSEAVEAYTKAINLHPGNAVYYCNRAAAFSKQEQHEKAIDDCQQALVLDPKYSKAFGRMGLAYSAIKEFHMAISCYKQALELDPDNESYQNNLKIAEQKVTSEGGMPADAMGGLSGMGGMGGLGAMLNNPGFMQMAQQMMASPQMQDLMSNMLGQGGAPAPGTEGQAPAGGIDNLLRVGQQVAQQMQAANPELVAQLRQQMGAQEGGNQSSVDGNNDDQQPQGDQPPPPNSS